MYRSYKVSPEAGYMGAGWPSTHDPALNGWIRKSHQLSRQIVCGATVGSEANEKLEVKAKSDDLSTFGTKR